MELSIALPLWSLIAFGSVAYPSIGYGLTKVFNKASMGRAPMSLSAFVCAFWPAALALAAVGFPVWAVVSVVRNYFGSIKNTLAGMGGARPIQSIPTAMGGRSVRVNVLREGALVKVISGVLGGCTCRVESVGPEGQITIWQNGRYTLRPDEYVMA